MNRTTRARLSCGMSDCQEESDILKIHTGQEVSVFLDVYGRSFDGYVQEVNTVTSNRLSGGATSFTTSGTYTKVTQLIPVRIKLDAGAFAKGVVLANGMTATVIVERGR